MVEGPRLPAVDEAARRAAALLFPLRCERGDAVMARGLDPAGKVERFSIREGSPGPCR